MRVYNEKSGVEFEAWFESVPGVPTVPPSVHWRLRCATNDQTLSPSGADSDGWVPVAYEILSDETGITGVRSVIDVPGSLNALVDRNNRRETRELQIVAAKDAEREYSVTHQYYVTAMGGR